MLNGDPASLLACHKAWHDSWNDFLDEDFAGLNVLLKRGALTQALPRVVQEFEKSFAEFAGAKFCLSFCNGSTAIHAALWAVGVRSGDEVLVADYGYHGVAASVLALGARLVPCDIDALSLCLDPAEIDAARGPATKAVLVHNPWGMPANWHELQARARKAGLALISDASHAHGAVFEDQPMGALAEISCYSLGLRKLISGGELGCAVTSSPELRDRMVIYAHVNRVPRDLVTIPWTGDAVGLKARPHPFAAALALPQIRRFPEKLERLRKTCSGLEERFAQIGLLGQRADYRIKRAYWRLVLRIDENRWSATATSELEEALRESGFPAEPNAYWPPLQERRIFEWVDYVKSVRRRPCPRVREVTPRLITLPAPVQLDPALLEQSFVDLDKRISLFSKRSGAHG
jgi:dTDP-4-amino-4,6-dideoxygalactose transaminase